MGKQLARVLSKNRDTKIWNEKREKKYEYLAKQVEIEDAQVLHFEHYSRNCNIEANKNSLSLLEKIGEKVGKYVVLRVLLPNTSTEINTVVQFVRLTKRNAVLEKYRKSRV